MSSQLSLAIKCATGVFSASDENGDAFRLPLATITIPTVNRTGMSQLSNSSSTFKKGKLSTNERANCLFQLSVMVHLIKVFSLVYNTDEIVIHMPIIQEYFRQGCRASR
jgi:hypothetical protein